MKYDSIHISAWNPRSTVHLKAFYRAFTGQESDKVDSNEIKKWLEGMELKEIAYSAEAINAVRGEFENGFLFDFEEDGLMQVSKELEDLTKDIQRLRQFMKERVLRFWQNLFNKISPLPKVFDPDIYDFAFLVTVNEATDEDIANIYSEFESQQYKKITLEKGVVYIGDSLVVLNDVDMSKQDLRQAIGYLLFARTYEMRLVELVSIQRTVWNKIEGIRGRTFRTNRELLSVRDEIFNIHGEINFLKSMSKQMEQFLEWRKKLIIDYLGDSQTLSLVFKNFFISLSASQNYIYQLIVMTDNYSDSSVEYISFLYAENERRELATLQKLFLFSAVTSVLTLGTLSGVRVTTFTPQGEVVSLAIHEAWNISDFIFYGAIAFFISIAIYYIFWLAFSKLKEVRLFEKTNIINKFKKED